jgi:hypothetical protein
LSATDPEGNRIQTDTEEHIDSSRPTLFALSTRVSQRSDERLTFIVLLVGTMRERREYLDNVAERMRASKQLFNRLEVMKGKHPS